jgi:hypothetical protein
MRAPIRRALVVLLGSALAVSLVAGCGSSDGGDDAADPAAQTAPQQLTDRQLAGEFFRVLKDKDMDELDAFLSPAFQLQRTDGSYVKKAEYLKNPSVIDSFELVDVSGTRYGNTRVIRFVAKTSAIINGKQTTNDPAPRLATYVWNGKRWQVVSYANYVAFHPTTTTTTPG